MRCAVMILNDKGAQVLGVTSDEAKRLGEQGIAEFPFGGYTLRFIVDEHADPLPPARDPYSQTQVIDPGAVRLDLEV